MPKIRDLTDEWTREFGPSALEVLVDQAMGEYPFEAKEPADRLSVRLALKAAFARELSAEQQIEWAAKISEDIVSFEDFTSREIGE